MEVLESMRIRLVSVFVLLTAACLAQVADSPWLYGIHWYGDTGSTDVEAMSGGKGVWDLEITHVDASAAPAWDQPGYFASSVCPTVTGRGHSMVFRVQPYWSRNVPHSVDPYTLTNYAADAKNAATTLVNFAHIWQIGNEVNLSSENLRWDGSGYTIQWQPTPAEYAATYVAVRDRIHEVTPNTSPNTQVVLMQPNSPGNAGDPTIRFMDGNEYLWRQIDAVADKGKIDGFAIHGYSDPFTAGIDYGMEGFWDSITEQISIIDQSGLGDRPILITEWNKHMPDAGNANVGAKFLHRAFTRMNQWNTGSGDMWLGQANHNIVGACWFVYPSGLGWDEYSLERWKTDIASTDPELNPWYSFQYAAGLSYARGGYNTGPTVPMNAMWWEDEFTGAAGTAPDTTAPVPDWKVETGSGGTAQLSGDGALRLRGNSSAFGLASIRTAGYAYGDFHLEAEIQIVNGAPASGNASHEANFDLRAREGSKGYSLTFYPGGSGVNPNRIILRRTNEWTQIGSYDQLVSGGINNGDRFLVRITADGSSLVYRAYKNGGATPVVDWTVSDSGQVVGNLRLMTYNLQEARVEYVRLGGPSWNPAAGVEDWAFYR